MQEIANAGLCKIFVDRENRIVIKCEDEEPQKSPIAVVPGNMFSYKSNITLTDFSNSVSVDYCEISIKDDVIDVAEPEIRLEPNETKLMTIDYTSEVAYPTAASNNAAVRIVSFKIGQLLPDFSCLFLTLFSRLSVLNTLLLWYKIKRR